MPPISSQPPGTLVTSDSIKSQLIGTWELVSCIATNEADPIDVIHTWTENVEGLLLYSSDGYVSVMLQIPGEEMRLGDRLGRPFTAYSGRFDVDESDKMQPVVYHHVRHASLAAWYGQTQKRLLTLSEEDGTRYLVLSPANPVIVDGILRKTRLTWRKAKDNYAREKDLLFTFPRLNLAGITIQHRHSSPNDP